MKKMFDLQLFAEDAANSAAQAVETKPTETDAKVISEEKPDGKTKTAAKYTDEDFDRKLNQKFAEWQKNKEKEISEAKKLAEMNAQEKAEYELNKEREAHAETQKALDKLKRKDTLSEMTKTARKMLSDSGINASDEILSVLVTTDAEQTKNAIDGFTKLYKEAVEAGVKERLRGETPKAGTGVAAPVSEIDKRIKKYL